jgi:coenzyme F420-0:L-glutamate ligase/coenzyme F420-1:gamma-L-glutamate ligase
VSRLAARSVSGLPEIRAGDDLAALIAGALSAEALSAEALSAEASSGAPTVGATPAAGDPGTDTRAEPLRDGQVVAIAHKVVSKAEGAVVALADVRPSARAVALAREQGKDPRAVQVVLDQSREIVRAAHGVLICRTHHGFLCANAGVDASNAPAPTTASAAEQATGAGAERGAARSGRAPDENAPAMLIVLPRDPDASARALRARLRELSGARVAVLITDSFGRAWRHGQCDVALGCAGMTPLEDWRGRTDGVGMELRATWLAVADAAAAAADLARAKDSREPVVILDGLQRFVTDEDGSGAVALRRPLEEDLFR